MLDNSIDMAESNGARTCDRCAFGTREKTARTASNQRWLFWVFLPVETLANWARYNSDDLPYPRYLVGRAAKFWVVRPRRVYGALLVTMLVLN